MHSLPRFFTLLTLHLKNMKKYIVSLITFIALFYSGNFAFAQNLSDGDTSNDVCINLQTPVLRFRSNDVSTNGEVSLLQDFLIDKGYLTGSPTGFYGRLTVNAVKSYQREIGVSPTGNVGPLTKSFIQRETCDGAQPLPVPVVISPGNGVKSFTFYKVSDDKRSCKVAMFVGNVGLVNGMYVYKSGEFATEAECRNALGVTNQNNSQPYISSASVEINSGGARILRVYGSNLSDTVMVNGCRSFSSQKGDTTMVPFYIDDAFNSCISAGYDFSVYMTSSMNTSLRSNIYMVKNSPVVSIDTLSAGLVPNQMASDAQLFRIEVEGRNLNSLNYLQTEILVDGVQSITRSSFIEATDNKIVFNYKVCSGCKYMMSVSGVDRNGVKTNVMSIQIDNSTQQVPVSIDARMTNFTDSDGYGDNFASFSYSIRGYNSKHVLRVTPKIVCTACGGLDSYRISLSAAAGETYSDGKVNFYDKDGINYTFTGANGSINFMRNMNETVGINLFLEVVDTASGSIVARTIVTPTVKG